MSMSVFIQWGTISFPFLSLSFLTLSTAFSSFTEYKKTARTWWLVKGMDTVHRPWGHLFPLIKGECKYLSGQILISIQREGPSSCLSGPKLSVQVCVHALFSVCACPAIRHKTHRQWQCHLISSAPPLLSWVCIFITEMTLHVCGQVCVCIPVCLCDSVYVFMHKICWCVWFCGSKMTRWPDCYQM